MNIKITEDELFDLIEILNMKIQHDKDLIPLFEKLLTYQKPLDLSKTKF